MSLRHFILILPFIFLYGGVAAQLELTATGTPYTIDFDNTVAGVNNGSFDASGYLVNPTPGTLDTDGWRLEKPIKNYGVPQTGGRYALGCGGGGINDITGVYCFEEPGVISGKALGIQPGNQAFVESPGDPGEMELKLVNNTGLYLTSIELSIDYYVRNDQPKSTMITTRFDYATTINGANIGTSRQPYSVQMPDMTLVTGGNPTGSTFVEFPRTHTLEGIYVKPGEVFFINWQFTDANSAAGTRDEIGFDNISITANGTSDLTFYSRNSSIQRSNPNQPPLPFPIPIQQWSTVPTGGVSYTMSPTEPVANYVIQSGNTVNWQSTAQNSLMKDLIVNAGGRLLGSQAGTTGSLNDICILGDVICNGEIGNANGSFSSIALNIESGTHTISGSGAMRLAVIRKSNQFPSTHSSGQTTLFVNKDLTLLKTGIGLYNHCLQAHDFDVDINANVLVLGDVALDAYSGGNGENNSIGGGLLTINDQLTVEGATHVTTDNTSNAVGLLIPSGGQLNTGHLLASASNSSGHVLFVNDGGHLNITDVGSGTVTWSNLSLTNNDYNLNGLVEYSRGGAQEMADLPYHDLQLSGSDMKTAVGGDLTIEGDIDIISSATLVSTGGDIIVHGAWSSYGQLGFDELGTTVRFVNDGADGDTRVSCSGGEIFDRLSVDMGRLYMYSDVRVRDELSLEAVLVLNSNTLFIDEANGIVIAGNGNEAIISEDVAHAGRVIVEVGTASTPVSVPFGRMDGELAYCRFTRQSGDAGSVTFSTYSTPPSNMPLPTTPVSVVSIPSASGLTPDNGEATVDRYFYIQPSGGSVVADVELGFSDDEVPAAPFNSVALFEAQRYDDPAEVWNTAFPTQTAFPNVSALGYNFVLIEAADEFGEMAIASSDSPLPVELLIFDAEHTVDGNMLHWMTASESDNDRFELSVSRNGQDFEYLASIDGSGNSSSLITYDYLDRHSETGIYYYQLVQYDFNGSRSDPYFASVEVKTDARDRLRILTVTNGVLTYSMGQLSPRSAYRVFDMRGSLVLSGSSDGSIHPVRIDELEAGAYILQVLEGERLQSERFVLH